MEGTHGCVVFMDDVDGEKLTPEAREKLKEWYTMDSARKAYVAMFTLKGE